MLFKSLEFKNAVGQKVKITEIPVLAKDSPYYFMIQVRLKTFIAATNANPLKNHSFREYLKRVLKWPVYEEIFKTPELKNNA
ncbi:YpmP family protein [Cytobacillus firmus]|uniref:YpmP family protein n=1 Tax=Cytobacillus firmus TaxID=1399 RepID=A0AA46SIS0_CYTFI|nr:MULTISPECIES: DUF2535 family protein [Bacillaceae]KML42425.1 hypothetical protein VL14_08735 [Cytobacillus firmus]MBG9445163.1 hypothetical protein [Cytobacillus firmus]MBG9590658.1 hypothetical protein [Cytobacillus firmus]MBY6051542.1 YpmP family protein [Cytobacillus firmus]MCC3648005.1 DUF2535 family protein [Cytobacillus oceanisediminis]